MKSKIRILHIDDNIHDRKLVKDALQKEHKEFEVVEADSREKFEKYLAEGRYDVVLSDFNIFGFDGLQVLQLVKEKHPDLPVIIVTGTGSEEIAIQAMKMGASDYVIKSVSHIRGLATSIHRVLENKKIQDERKTILSTLQEREERYRSIYENTSVAILLSIPDGIILSANDYACKLFQRTAKEICEVGRNGLVDVTDPRLEDLLEERKREGRASGELTFIKKDGTKFQAEVSSVIFKDSEGNERTSMVITDLSEQKKAEEELRILSSRNEAILDSVPDIIMEVDKNKIYTWANSAGFHFFGDDVIGKEASYYFEGQQDTYEVVTPLFNGKSDHIIYVESLQRRRDGEKRMLAWWCRALKDKSGKVTGTISTAQDITERRKAQERLIESEEKHRTLFETMMHGVVYQDSKGRIFAANKSAQKILGLSLDQMNGKTSFDPGWRSIHEDGTDFPGDKHPAMLALKTGKEVRNVIMGVFNPEKEKYIWINICAIPQFRTGERIPHQVYTTFEDITERRNAEEELKKSETRFRSYFELSLAGIAITSPKAGWLEVNDRVCEMLKYSRDELLRMTWSEITHPDDLDVDVGLFNRVMAGEIDAYSIDKRFICKDGEYLWTSLSVRCVRLKDGSVEYLVVLFFDISNRKRAEQELQESMQNYRELIDGMNETVWVVDFNGDIIDINNATLRELGYTKDELLSIGLYGIDTSLKKEEIRKLAGSMPEDKIQIFETTHKTKDGRIFPVEVYSSIVSYQGKKAILSIARDITERKKTEELISRERKLLRTLIDSLPDAIYIKDNKGCKLIANAADMKIMNCTSEDEIIGKTDLEIYNTDAGARGYQEDMSVLKTGQALINREDSYIDAEGKEHIRLTSKIPLYDDQGKISGLVGFGHDITDRKQAEKDLAWEQYLMHSLLDNIPDSIYFKDTESRFIRINKALANRFNLENPFMALGRSDKDFFKDEHSVPAYSDEQEIILTGKAIINKEEEETWFDKSPTWVSTTKMPLIDDKGKIIGTFGVSRDITEMKILLDDLMKAKKKAEESDKLKTAFLNNISHEIRTPMNAIVGFSGLLYDKNLPDDKHAQYLDLIRQSSDRLLSIITDIVNISTIDAGQMKIVKREFNLNQKLETIIHHFRNEALKKNIELIFEPGLSDSESMINTDEKKLIQILKNLIDNAFKFTNKGHVRFGYWLKDNNIEFFIKDTGIGIPLDQHEKIFERFRQVDFSATRKYGGTGLGLSISKAYIDLLGGKIWLKSEPGKGTTFYFSIPVEAIKIATVESEILDYQPIKQDRPKTILVAEDEEMNYELIVEYLLESDIHLLRALNGIEAVDLCRNNTDIDMVLMDIKMPKMDGFEATRQIRMFNKVLPVIALTAYTQSEDMETALDAGCNMFVSKPVKQDELIALIYKYLKQT